MCRMVSGGECLSTVSSAQRDWERWRSGRRRAHRADVGCIRGSLGIMMKAAGCIEEWMCTAAWGDA